MVSRSGQEYGPYTREELQQYLSAGNLVTGDSAREENSTTWTTVAEILAAPIAPVVSGVQPPPPVVVTPGNSTSLATPPNLHWAIVLLLTIFTCGLFGAVWFVVQSAWMKSVKPDSRALFFYLGSLACTIITSGAYYTTGARTLVWIFDIASIVLWIIAALNMKASMEEYYRPIALRLGTFMSILFNVVYFQFHFNKISEVKATGQVA